MPHKLVLGTAQFGMVYGINNKRGKIPRAEALEVLRRAVEAGMDTFDTAYSYGESEKLLGDYIKSKRRKINIISKLPECANDEARKFFLVSLKKLGVSRLYGYLVHKFENFKNSRKIWSELEKLKKEGMVEKIGFSLYLPAELESIFKDDLQPDIIQIPFSIFDRRFKPYFSELKKREIEIYVRSIFLQGMVFKEPCKLASSFSPLKSRLEELAAFARSSNVSVLALCLGFALCDKFIDKAVIGVDGAQQLDEILRAAGCPEKVQAAVSRLPDLEIEDENIILPFKWTLKGIAA